MVIKKINSNFSTEESGVVFFLKRGFWSNVFLKGGFWRNVSLKIGFWSNVFFKGRNLE